MHSYFQAYRLGNLLACGLCVDDVFFGLAKLFSLHFARCTEFQDVLLEIAGDL